MHIIHVFNLNQMHHANPKIINFSILPISQEFILIDCGVQRFEIMPEIMMMRNVTVVQSKYANIYFAKAFRRAGCIIVCHSLNKKILYMATILRLIGLKKASFIWVTWGEGVNRLNPYSIVHVAQRLLYRTYDKIVSLMSSDRDLLVSKFNVKHEKTEVIPYINPNLGGYEWLEESLNFKKSHKDSKIRVIVGHSASEKCKHIKYLDILSRLNLSHLEIILFLNYSATNEYIDEVESYAKKNIPDDSLIIYKNFLSRSDYNKVFQCANILIVESQTQAGLGAIWQAVMSGVTVYLNPDGNNSKWLDYLGIKYLSTDNVQALCCLSDEDLINNVRVRLRYFSVNNICQRWLRLFESSVSKNGS